MSKDLKDIIDTVEKDTKSHAELEAEINSLKEEINKLNGIIDEQKMLINEGSDSISLDVSNIPGEVDILKELIISQRKELIKKDEANESLNDKIDELKIKLEKTKDGTFTKQDNEDLIQAQELILAFTEESEDYRNQIEELKSKIKSLSGKSEFEDITQESTGESEEIVNIKRLNFQLMEENGLLRVETESLKVQLQEQIEELNSGELQLAHQKIEALSLELEEYDAQIQQLQQKLETVVTTPVNQTHTTDEFNNLKEEILKYQDENQRLNNNILELDQNHPKQLSKNDYKSVIFHFPQEFQISLFQKMYNLLDDIDKKTIINSLIKDLNSKNNDVKRAILKILRELRDEKVYKVFLDLLHDEDWVIRYNVIKALTNFGFDNKAFRDLLKKLTKDSDIDVRELAMKVLETIS
ncbi:MAG: HEAT repeat domain-containing protein [Candidatus Lokiarchaeota archaeon]|nr:HEAT repeat domain-containing protein [Candidatus Lokiarchaeota archaeon]